MTKTTSLPTITFIIPTLNSAQFLTSCLRSIRRQNYPQSKISVFVIDGGSTDSTITIAQNFSCHLLDNPHQTAEAAKAIGLSQVTTTLVALVDSDNILPSPHWLKKMVAPFSNDPSLVGAEPWKFTYRPSAGYIERYCALLGANDPFAYISQIYDRYSHLSQRWTGLSIPTQNAPGYLFFTLGSVPALPTIGANGTIYRYQSIKKYLPADYFFDTDFLSLVARNLPRSRFAKVKLDIIHSYGESSVGKFYRKQLRRVRDYYSFHHLRLSHPHFHSPGYRLKFVLYTLGVIPPFLDSFKGFSRLPDPAWFFHPLACFLTLFAYSYVSLLHQLGITQFQSRDKWRQ